MAPIEVKKICCSEYTLLDVREKREVGRGKVGCRGDSLRTGHQSRGGGGGAGNLHGGEDDLAVYSGVQRHGPPVTAVMAKTG